MAQSVHAPYQLSTFGIQHSKPPGPCICMSNEPESVLACNTESVTSGLPLSYTLTPTEKVEIEAALQSFEDLGLDGQHVTQDTFPLPILGNRLKQYAEELHKDKDFFVLSGLNTDEFTHEQNIIIFLGVSSYIANLRGNQTDDGKLFAHIKNAPEMTAEQDQRPLRDSNRSCAFHNDLYCDILAMQTHSAALRGGDLFLASAAQVHDQMSRVRPDLAKLLFEPIWPHDLRRRFASSEMRPILFKHNNRLISSLLTDSLTGFPDLTRPAELPDMTDAQMEALTLFQSIAYQNRVTLPLRKGDLTYINNFAVVHARDNFEDSTELTRYVVRMWLKNEELSWDLPSELQPGHHAIFHDAGLHDVWNIHPETRTKFHVYERATP